MLLPRIPIPAHDGGALAILGAVRALHDAGHCVDVVVLNTKRHHADPSVMRPYCNDVLSFDIDTSISAVGAFRNLVAPKRSGAGGWSLQGRSVPLSYWLERFVHDTVLHGIEQMALERPPYDVYVCESLFTAPYGFELLRMMAEGAMERRPVVLRAHNVEYRIQQRMAAERSRPLLERLYRAMLAWRTRRFEREVALRFDGVNVMTETDADVFRTLGADSNLCVIPPGVVMPDASIATILPVPDTICLMGSLEWPPNVQGALWFLDDVLPRILEQRPATVVHVAGRGDSAAVRARHNGRSVIVHGEVADAQAFRAAAAVSVVPLFSGSGIRIKIQEAMALARPVVTTSVGIDGIPAVDGEHVCVADTPQDVAAACVALLADANRAHAMGQAAQGFARERYGWQRFVDAVIPWYQRTAASMRPLR